MGEDEKLYDTIQAKQIVESDVLSLEPGLQCKAVYSGAAYDVKVIAKGKVRLKSVVTELPGDTNLKFCWFKYACINVAALVCNQKALNIVRNLIGTIHCNNDPVNTNNIFKVLPQQSWNQTLQS